MSSNMTEQFSETPYNGMSTGSPSDKYAWYYPMLSRNLM